MSYPSPHSALRAYQQVGIQAAASGATPHALIGMLLQGALDRIATAKGLMQRRDPAKGALISKAISILGGLRDSLNFEVGGALSSNLDSLYEYCQHRLLQANMSDDLSLLDEVTGLLREIKEAWEEIGDEARGPLAPGAQAGRR